MKVPFAFFNYTRKDSQRLGFNLCIKKGLLCVQVNEDAKIGYPHAGFPQAHSSKYFTIFS